MVVENLRIDVTPGGVPLVIHVSQYDAGLRQFNFTPYDKGVQMAKISGATVTVEATKPDGYAVQHPCTYNNDGTITYVLQEQLAAVEGQVWSKLTWRNSNGDVLGAKAIIWAVDTAGIEDGAVVSESDLPLLEEAAEFAQTYEERLAEAVASIHVVPGQVVIDGTLTVPGAAADAKATGDRVSTLESAVAEMVPGLSDDAKVALLDCFAHVVWVDAQGQVYYDALRDALYAEEYPKITAVYSPGSHVVLYGDNVDTLKPYLTVTYYEDRASAGEVLAPSDYVLSGALINALSVVTVTYGENTATVSVAVENPFIYRLLNTPVTLDGTDDVIETGVQLLSENRSFTIAMDFNDNRNYSSDPQQQYAFGCYLGSSPYTGMFMQVYDGGSQEGGAARLVRQVIRCTPPGASGGQVLFDSIIPVAQLVGRRVKACIAYDQTTGTVNAVMSVNGTTLTPSVTMPITYNFTAVTTELYLGARRGTQAFANFLKGVFNDFRVYDYALSNDEMSAYIGE